MRRSKRLGDEERDRMSNKHLNFRIENLTEDVGKEFNIDRAGIISMLDEVLRERVSKRFDELRGNEVLASALNKKINESITQVFREMRPEHERIVRELVRARVEKILDKVSVSALLGVLIGAVEEQEAD